MIIVPTTELVTQWNEGLLKFLGHTDNIYVSTIQSAVKKIYNVGMLVLDEIHVYGSEVFSRIYSQVTYKTLLQLTATIERNDGGEKLLLEKAPIIDTVTLKECIANGWVAQHRQYVVLLDVPMNQYETLNQTFIKYFSYFDYNLMFAMKCLRDKTVREKFARKMGYKEKEVYISTLLFMKALRARKKFVEEHPKKIEIANKILENRPNSKAITFSKTISFAKKVKYGANLSSKASDKVRCSIMDAFKNNQIRVLNTVNALNVGFDDDEVDLSIIISGDSSKISKYQRVGRTIRKKGDKSSEIFHLVINGSQEMMWMKKSSVGMTYDVITESELDNVLAYKEYKTAKRNQQKTIFEVT